jgi:alkanesulfonate monooxygenase SsuD/methylene tetrahydromethanopterin reductase-like flavin-dependent oxidoreductase (luciferase family)
MHALRAPLCHQRRPTPEVFPAGTHPEFLHSRKVYEQATSSTTTQTPTPSKQPASPVPARQPHHPPAVILAKQAVSKVASAAATGDGRETIGHAPPHHRQKAIDDAA